jgi:hypothetical protein
MLFLTSSSTSMLWMFLQCCTILALSGVLGTQTGHNQSDFVQTYRIFHELSKINFHQKLTGNRITLSYFFRNYSCAEDFNPLQYMCLDNSVADPGCLSRIRIFSIPDPGSASKKKLFLSSRKYDPGCSSRIRIQIRILILYPLRIPDPGVKKAPDPWSGSATLLDRRTNVNFRQDR